MRKVVLRADASLEIGVGHVMRCLTLADALRQRGVECHFISREHPGHLIEQVRERGYCVHVLPCEPAGSVEDDGVAHGAWLGSTQPDDVQACRAIMAVLQPDWLIVDHYALDSRWERELKPYCKKLLVIDDLADRSHDCDMLLDQTLGRDEGHYRPWVPAHCVVLCGVQYALLRPEFAALRAASLERRSTPRLLELLVTMGGVDKDNATGQVLEALRYCELPAPCRITVVLGPSAPWLSEVRSLAEGMPWSTRVLVGVSNMGQLMADSDLAIGAAGATSWERCCLGLPTLMMVLAVNQRLVANVLEAVGAAWVLGPNEGSVEQLPEYMAKLANDLGTLGRMGRVAAGLLDGRGADVVVKLLEESK
ncbi:UDP-2,4-diacetamido-2,4,6-trideoxy-beta-L-altropyranose hydrolase [Pseudomonas mosselii]|uniref:UDP-2,4-diacetamido-2,4, 6-trideoxy-beta-L-altropyranose hydrolase n=1 Tax=Pseudomonas mosselii TaxID=78327 RepID=UPI001644AF5A|nr:UDP-2,4-diacetamido-2,4,6-trideoxy-beta-L-altropyranose hydrolase [Pseudomonas mosselii]MBC3457524.1 UDP-2,4-diacetamido-2,4,6-trideoxy-beta-L-altropyranose hydrolase [Pseudomonas mosselii]